MVEIESVLKYAALFTGVVVIAGAVSFFIVKKFVDPNYIRAEARAEVDAVMTAALQKLAAQNTKTKSDTVTVPQPQQAGYYYQV